MFVGRLLFADTHDLCVAPFTVQISAAVTWLNVFRNGFPLNLSAVSEHVTMQSGNLPLPSRFGRTIETEPDLSSFAFSSAASMSFWRMESFIGSFPPFVWSSNGKVLMDIKLLSAGFLSCLLYVATQFSICLYPLVLFLKSW